jgi:hypothetical protein
VFDKIPQRTSSMPRGQGSSSRSSGFRATAARPSMESRKLLLENTFAVKEVFSNNEATSWAVEELKRRGLKRLFKPVASTTYERLVREFYTHLRIDDDQPDSLFSSIDGRNVEVTVGDIAAVLKCSHEPPESDIPWLECPSILTLEDIVSDMCEGQYTTTAEMQLARRRFLGIFSLSTWCCIEMCVLWDTRQRGGTYFSVPSTLSTEDSSVLFRRLYGVKSINFVREYIIEERSTRRRGIAFPLSHHTHFEKGGDQRYISGWAYH